MSRQSQAPATFPPRKRISGRVKQQAGRSIEVRLDNFCGTETFLDHCWGKTTIAHF